LNLDTSFFTSFVKENDDCVHQGVLNLSIWSCVSYMTFRLLRSHYEASVLAKNEKRHRKVHQDLPSLSSQQSLSTGHLSTT
jgi:hypothetical protein